MNKFTQVLNVIKNPVLGALRAFGGFFQDRFSFLSETKIWAAIFVLAIPTGAFLLPNFDLVVAGLFLAFAFSLTNGSLVSDQISPLKNLKGLGILDLVTNKANKFDSNRALGHIVFLAVLAYVFQPLWSPETQVRSDLVGLVGTLAVAIFTTSPCDDAKAVAKAQGTAKSESAQ